MTESETVELKKSLAELKEGLISICAMLNKHGTGELWFGVAPSGQAIGLHATEKACETSRKLILDQYPQAQQWDNQPLNLPIKALNSAKVKAFAKQAGLVWSSLGTNDTQRMQQALTKLEVQEDGQMLNAAKLFFTHLPIQMRCAVFAGTASATILDRHDFDGDILSLIEASCFAASTWSKPGGAACH